MFRLLKSGWAMVGVLCVGLVMGCDDTPKALTFTTNLNATETVADGNDITYTVVVSGTQPVTYVWKNNGVVIGGETASSYTLSAVYANNNGDVITCEATNTVGTIVSVASTLTVAIPIIFTTNLNATRTVTDGNNITYTVAFNLNATQPVTYVWKNDGIVIGGETGNSYTLSAVYYFHNGDVITCEATNAAGTTVSVASTLTVVPVAPSITIDPASITVLEGNTPTFTVAATGSFPLTYQWKKGGVDVGANSANYTMPVTVYATDNDAQITCVVTNDGGSDTSNAATLTLTQGAPEVVTHPTGAVAYEGNTTKFTIFAAGTAPLSYQWQRSDDGGGTWSDIIGATSASYTTPAVVLATDSGAQFACVIQNSYGSIATNTATLTVFKETKITASDGVTYDIFGESVAVSGDTVVVGARYDSDNGISSGSVYIYRWNGNNWNETKITASDAATSDYFGCSVAVSGDTVVVGAYGDDDNGTWSGSAYIYQWSGSSWVETKITSSDGAAGECFGTSVAVSGDTVVVGADDDDDNGDRSGSAYIYQWDGSSWVETKITASDGAANDYFGISVAVNGNTVVIGAAGDDDSGANSGSVYIYQWSGSSWVETKIYTATTGSFGGSVGVSGDTVVVGALSGSAYIYKWDGSNWVETKITASDAVAGDQFGRSVAVSGDTVVVGAWEDDDNGTNSGSAYIYQWDGSSWVETKITAGDGAAYDVFGHSVVVSGDTVVVGAPWDDDSGLYSGSVYIYQQ